MPTKTKPKRKTVVVDDLLPEDDEALLREIEHYKRTGRIVAYAR